MLWIAELSRVQLYLIEAAVFIKSSYEVFMKQVAAACQTRSRTGSLLNSEMENSSLFMPLT